MDDGQRPRAATSTNDSPRRSLAWSASSSSDPLAERLQARGFSRSHSLQLQDPVHHRQGSLLTRGSSFGGAPLIVSTSVAETETSSRRWWVLLLSCLLLFGNYYAYDNPAALSVPLQQYLGIDYASHQYILNLLYSVYSLPNMILPLVGGSLVDQGNPKWVVLGFSAVVCLGQTVFALGVQLKTVWIMVLGRVLFGIGGESISVAQASITTTWFRNKELAFALGLNLCIARFGSVVNAYLSPRIQVAYNVPTAIWFGSLFCYLSFASAVVLVMVIAPKPVPASILTDATPTVSSPVVASPTVASPVSPSSSTPKLPRRVEKTAVNPFYELLYTISKLPLAFWLVCIICILLYGTVVPFNNIASDFLQSKWYHNDTITAGAVMSIPDTMSAVLVPVAGMFVDTFGRRAMLLLFCGLAIASVHLTLALTTISPIYPLILLGLCYSIYGVVIWPSIATIVEWQEHRLADIPGTPSSATLVDPGGAKSRAWLTEQGHMRSSPPPEPPTPAGPEEPEETLSDSLTRRRQQRIARLLGLEAEPSTQSISEITPLLTQEHVEAPPFPPLRLTHKTPSYVSFVAAAHTAPAASHHPVKLLGTAYGLSTSALNTALTLMPLASAAIRNASPDFVNVELFFVSLAVGGAIVSGWLQWVDASMSWILTTP